MNLVECVLRTFARLAGKCPLAHTSCVGTPGCPLVVLQAMFLLPLAPHVMLDLEKRL